MEEYFDIYNIQSDEEKVKYASMHMEGYTYIINTYGGREIILPTVGTCSEMISLIGFKESNKMKFPVKLPDYNRLEVLSNSHFSGNPFRYEYLGFLTRKYLKPI